MSHELVKTKGTQIPRYYLIQRSILNRIEKGEWAPGEKIPPEKELAAIFGVSVGSVKTAMLNLSNSGFLNRVQGKGTFVAGSVIGRDRRRLYNFVSDFETQNEPLSVKLQEIKAVEGIAPICGYLTLPPNGQMFRVTRIFTLHESSIILSISYLAQRLFKDIDKLPRDFFESNPLYKLFEDTYKLPTIRYQEMFSAVQAPVEAVNFLQLSESVPLLKVEMLALTFKNVPLEYRISYCNTKDLKLFRMPFRMKTHRWGV